MNIEKIDSICKTQVMKYLKSQGYKEIQRPVGSQFYTSSNDSGSDIAVYCEVTHDSGVWGPDAQFVENFINSSQAHKIIKLDIALDKDYSLIDWNPNIVREKKIDF